MEIKTPVQDVPDAPYRGNKYSAIYKAVLDANGMWVPVEFESKSAARNFSLSVAQKRTGPKMEVCVRNSTAFVRVKQLAVVATMRA